MVNAGVIGCDRMMRSFHFSVRHILVATALAGILLIFGNRHVRNCERIAADVRDLLELRAHVEQQPPAGLSLARMAVGFSGYPTCVRKHNDTPPLPDASRFTDLIARNQTVHLLTLGGTEISDDDASRLLSLPLKELAITHCRTGDTLRASASNTLEWLSFHRTRLNDRSLVALGPLSNLKYLDLTRTRVTDKSIDYLAKLPALNVLIIRRCQITLEGKHRLERLRPTLDVRWEASN